MIKILLWDVDGTLLNFKKSERDAIRTCFSLFSLGEVSDEMIARYSVINHRYWEGLEDGIYTKQEVLVGRFRDFFASEGIVCDNVEGFNDAYQIHLGDTTYINDASDELMRDLHGVVLQYAVTNGTLVAQERKLKTSGLGGLFDDVFISDQIGIDKPNRLFFDRIWEKIQNPDPREVLIIGDSLTSDIRGGNNAGIRTCWYNPDHQINRRGVHVDYEITDLQQIRQILKEASI